MQWEAAELARRATEVLISQAPPPPPQRGNRIVTGTRGGCPVAICDGCYRDVPLTGICWWRCQCGGYRCDSCDLNECRVCHRPRWTRATVREATLSIETFDSQRHSVRARRGTDYDQEIGDPDPAAEGPTAAAAAAAAAASAAVAAATDAREWESAWMMHAFPAEPPVAECPEPVGDLGASPWQSHAEGLMLGAEPNAEAHARSPQGTGLRCRACGLTSGALPHDTSWRMCNCGATYCQWCLDEGCLDCPVVAFWDPEGPYTTDGCSDGHPAETIDLGHEPLGTVPCRLSPEAALRRRDQCRVDKARALTERRNASRAAAKAMVKNGRRPRRERRPRGSTRFVTANVNCVDRLIEELTCGSCIKTADFACIQETKTKGDAVGQAHGRCRALGWDAVGGEAYVKLKQAGGGTMVMTKSEGLYPLADEDGEFQGRIALSIASSLRGIVCGSLYGVTGGRVNDQLGLWRQLATRLAALGRPFLIGGDWQLDPNEPAVQRFAHSLDAMVVHPDAITNTVSQSRIDYYIVSKTILGGAWAVRADYSCAFSPHAAVVLDLDLSRTVEASYRLAQPRLLPIEPPFGPKLPQRTEVAWEEWTSKIDGMVTNNAEELGDAVAEWSAGAELELFDALGIPDDECEAYMGLGSKSTVVRATGSGRYREVADELGITGQRLCWGLKGAKLLLSAMTAEVGSDRQRKGIRVCTSFAFRAAALLREVRKARVIEGELEYREATVNLLTLVARARLWRHGRPPLLTRITARVDPHQLETVEGLVAMGAKMLERFAAWRRRQAVKASRRRAMEADLRTAHRATKEWEFVGRRTASADKAHAGESSDQRAADHGMDEWQPTWRGDDVDHGEELVRAIDDLYALGRAERDEEEILLPPLVDEERLWRVAGRFKGNTGVGQDWIRPRHIARVTAKARRAFLALLRRFETLRRWPALLRAVIEIALPKKGGGARLVGQATAMYRVWAKLRFTDIRRILEDRIARAYLPAAPGRGALHAAFDLAFDAEAARAKGNSSASTCLDLKQYYEQIEVLEIAKGCKRHGLPRVIAALAMHTYLGPRRIRVGNAVSRAVFPRRSILAGCTFALILIRLISIDPIDEFLKIIKRRLVGWDLQVRLVLYVDDGIVSTYGSIDAVAWLHGFITKLVLDWVARVLRKEVATHKLSCICSSADLVSRLNISLAVCGMVARTEGEVLGVDFAAGGKLRTKPTQMKRRRKALGRKRRLKWWKAKGGNHASSVARGGLVAGAAYGDPVTGISNAALRDYRRIHGASSSVHCAGASLTAKLAIGGADFGEHDPAVLMCNPPMVYLLRKLWDLPGSRSDFIRSWRRAREDLQPLAPGEWWRSSRGPVMAAWMHCWRIGIVWEKPFVLVMLGHPVDLLLTPPRQVMDIMAAHARRHYDHLLIRRLGLEYGWDAEAVDDVYRHGIDWDLIRRVLRGKGDGGPLLPLHRRGLELLICGGFWPEQRRWKAGIRGNATCEACGSEVGDELHRIHGCIAMHFDAVQARAGGLIPRIPSDIDEKRFAPLLARGLPPKPLPWTPVDGGLVEGNLQPEPMADVYGDGSGYLQQTKEIRRATWAINCIERGADGEWVMTDAMRGAVPGWFSTVPRGELHALVYFLRHAGSGARFFTDCQAVADGIMQGVPKALASAASFHADLWRQVREGVNDRGEVPVVIKIKSHRSRSAALVDDGDLRHWSGNGFADLHAKSLAKSLIGGPHLEPAWCEPRESATMALRRIAFGVGWALLHWPELDRKLAPRPRDDDEGDDQDTGHILRRREDGGLECALCRRCGRTANGMARLRREICGGAIAHQIHESHVLRFTNGVTWCASCGAFTSCRPRYLLQECRRRPWTADRRNILRRLMAGLPPSEAAHFHRAAVQQGAPAGRPDYVGSLRWAKGESGGPRCSAQHEPPTGLNLAAPPARRYPRLDAQRRREEGRAEETPPPLSAERIEEAEPARQQRNQDLCRGDGPWASRLWVASSRQKSECQGCGELTSTWCRGCERRLCLRCARGRVPCGAHAAPGERGPPPPPTAVDRGVGHSRAPETDPEGRGPRRAAGERGRDQGECQDARGPRVTPRPAVGQGSRADLLRALSRAVDPPNASARQLSSPFSCVGTTNRDVSSEQVQHATPAAMQSRGSARRATSTPVQSVAPATREDADAHDDDGVRPILTSRKDLLRALASGNGTATLAVGARASRGMTRTGGNDHDHRPCIDGHSAAATAGQSVYPSARGGAMESAGSPIKANSGVTALHEDGDVDVETAAAAALAACSVVHVHEGLPLPAAAACERLSTDVDV